MVNCITADICSFPWHWWGFGTKIGYWRAHGHTDFLKRRTQVFEVPLTFYLRRVKEFDCGLRTYASLGGGVAWIKEKSCHQQARVHKGVGEVECGLQYSFCRCLQVVSAFRYLFPRHSVCCETVDVGGFDLRAGIGVSF
jgi:hypothetical protein